jgi:succinate dehydrogenase / fumarate reductase, cytochrome b subunit
MKKYNHACNKRPVNLDLTTLVFPPMAIVSILHRISGVVLFLLLPVMLYWLSLSLRGVTSFTDLQLGWANPYWKLALWMMMASAWFHVLAGIRHMVMDLGIGESISAGRLSAIVVIVLGMLSGLGLGIWVW